MKNPSIHTTDDLARVFEDPTSFFSKEAKWVFRTRVHRAVYPGLTGEYYFVTSEIIFPVFCRRRYTVRMADMDTMLIHTVSHFGRYRTRSAAHHAARQLAKVARR